MKNLSQNILGLAVSENQVRRILLSLAGCDLQVKDKKLEATSEEVAVSH